MWKLRSETNNAGLDSADLKTATEVWAMLRQQSFSAGHGNVSL